MTNRSPTHHRNMARKNGKSFPQDEMDSRPKTVLDTRAVKDWLKSNPRHRGDAWGNEHPKEVQ